MERNTFLAVCAIGADRPGFVDVVSRYLADREINIEESRSLVLGSDFGLMLLVTGNESAIESLIAERKDFITQTGIEEVILRRTLGPDVRTRPDSQPYVLKATSLDHPDIVHQLTARLHQHNVNIESMTTHVAPAPVTGSPVFSMYADLSVPADAAVSTLRDELYDISARLNIDISFYGSGEDSDPDYL